jgi:hypothetical protein
MGERLSTFLALPALPFAWADASCAHWAAQWVEHATGARVSLPAFDSPREALRVIKQAGGIGPAIDAALAVQAQPWALAQFGDLMLYETPGEGVGYALAICNGQVSAVRDERGAVHYLPAAQAVASWPLRGLEA